MTLKEIQQNKPTKNSTLEHSFYHSYYNNHENHTRLQYGVHDSIVKDMKRMFAILDKMTPDMLKKVIKALKN